MTLTERTETMQLDDVDPRQGVRFANTQFHGSQVTLNFATWVDMGSPRQVLVTVTRVPRPQRVPERACTCGPGKEQVAHDLRNEPHFIGCPRWGTRLAS